jgi:hypothetical protein
MNTMFAAKLATVTFVWIRNRTFGSRSPFPLRHLWHQGSRGLEVLSAMYSFNCPTFLLTQQHWKLFFASKERNHVMTYPDGYECDPTSYVSTTCMMPMERDFLRALVICLLAPNLNKDVREELGSMSLAD